MKKLLTSLILVLTLLMPFSMVSAKSPAPSKVTVKSLKASGTNKITLKWNKAKNTSSYQISFKEGSGKWTVIATVKGSRTNYTHKASFTSGKKYTYQVKAYNASSRKYGAAKSKSITLPATPGKVQLVSARFSGKNVVIKWKKTSNATEYRILYKASQKAKWKKLASVKSSSASFTYKKGKTGYYTVQAYSKKTKKTGAYDTNGLALLSKTAIATPGKPAPSPSQPSAPTQQPAKPTTPAPNPVAPTPVPSVVKVSSLSVSDTNLTFTKNGEIKQVNVTVSPANATNKGLSWSSSNTGVATVNQDGVVIAVSNGIAYINVKAVDGSMVEKDIKVTVNIVPNTVKVQSITISPALVEFTSKGKTSSLTASVLPVNASNRNVTWSSANPGVATVNSNGVVTAVGDGNTIIYATANDGSGVKGNCSVAVRVSGPSYNNVENISLAGGKGNTIGPDFMEFSSVDFSKVIFEFSNNFDNYFEIKGYNSTEYAAGVTLTALRKGTGTITAKYNGKVIKKYNVTATSDWTEYLGYVSWRKSVESQIWTGRMTIKEKLDAAQNYIKTNFTYKLGADGPVYAYNQTPKTADCTTASGFMGDFAKDLGCTVGYVNMTTDEVYNSRADAMGAAGGHIFTVVKLNGQWVSYDAQPPHN